MRSAVVWLLACWAHGALAAVVCEPPRWTVDEPLRRGASVSREVLLRNTGSQPVALLGVSATGAAFGRTKARSLAPGEAVKLGVWLNAGHVYGPLTGEVLVRLDGQTPVRLPVSGQVVPAWQVGRLPREIGTGHYPPRAGPPVLVRFLYKEGCEHCMEALEEVVQPLSRYFGAAVRFECHDLNQPDGFVYGERLKQAYGVRTQANTYAFVGSRSLVDVLVDEQLYRLVLAELQAPTPAPELPPASVGGALLEAKLTRFGPWAAFGIGLLDGLNPCAFATIVFLIALLTRLGASRARVLAAGFGYAAAVYVTYTLLGLGVLRALTWFGHRRLLARALRWSVAAVALWFALLQVRDVRHLRRGGATRELSAQLPPRLKRGVHALLRWSTDPRWGLVWLTLATVAAGALVTLIEMACTSQLYLPVLLLLRMGTWQARALRLLLTYNLGFVVPLLVVSGAAIGGLSSEAAARWARAHLAACKLGLALLLVGLAGLLLMLR